MINLMGNWLLNILNLIKYVYLLIHRAVECSVISQKCILYVVKMNKEEISSL